jgi:hypothetical protein
MSGADARKGRLPPVLALRSVRAWVAACAALCIAAAALAIAADRHADAAAGRLHNARAELDAAHALLAEDGGPDAMARIARYRRLAASGVFDETDAVGWAEALLAAAAALRLPPPSFEVGPRQPLATDPAGGEPVVAVQAQPMRFTATGLHEEDLLRLLQSLRDTTRGAFRVEECRLQRAGEDSALAAECTLRWLVWPRAKAQDTGGAS